MQINVVFASDKNYLEQLTVAMCSLFETNPDLAFDTYILNSDIDGATWRVLEEFADRYDRDLFDIKVPAHEVEGLVKTWHFTEANYYRLFIPELLNAPKALYLDADVVVNGSIRDLYETDVSDVYLAAVVDPSSDRHHNQDLGMSEASKYLNSGVMLLNLVMWRSCHVKEKVIEFVKRKPGVIEYVDQCGINAIVDGKWKELHVKFNLQSLFLKMDRNILSGLVPAAELREGARRPIIIHYSGKWKPWLFYRMHRYRGLYWKYLRRTPYNHYLPKDLTLARIIGGFKRKVAKMSRHVNAFRTGKA